MRRQRKRVYAFRGVRAAGGVARSRDAHGARGRAPRWRWRRRARRAGVGGKAELVAGREEVQLGIARRVSEEAARVGPPVEQADGVDDGGRPPGASRGAKGGLQEPDVDGRVVDEQDVSFQATADLGQDGREVGRVTRVEGAEMVGAEGADRGGRSSRGWTRDENASPRRTRPRRTGTMPTERIASRPGSSPSVSRSSAQKTTSVKRGERAGRRSRSLTPWSPGSA